MKLDIFSVFFFVFFFKLIQKLHFEKSDEPKSKILNVYFILIFIKCLLLYLRIKNNIYTLILFS